MKKNINPFVLLLIMLGFSLLSFTQPTNYHYHKIQLKKKDLRVAFENSSFDKFEFQFKEAEPAHYILTGQAYKSNGDAIGAPFDVSKRNNNGKNLPNIELGTFTLSKNLMIDVGMKINRNYKLTPRKYKNASGHEEDYVSYFVHKRGPGNDDENPGYPINKGILAFQTFMLNPSPPAR